MPLIILFLLLPVVEIWLFVKVGENIGAWPTAGLVVVMAVAGIILVRVQGFTVINRARAAMEAGEFPTTALLDGLFVMIAGVLLIVPGFLTDILGILLFIPPLRRGLGKAIWGWLRLRSSLVVRRSGRTDSDSPGRIVEGSYREIRPDDAPSDPAIGPPTGKSPDRGGNPDFR